MLHLKRDTARRMHFNHYLQALDQDAPPQWRGKFLEYKVLKKQIKGLG